MLFRPATAIDGGGPKGAFTSTNLLPATDARGVLSAMFAVGAASPGRVERVRSGGPPPPDLTLAHPLAHIPRVAPPSCSPEPSAYGADPPPKLKSRRVPP